MILTSALVLSSMFAQAEHPQPKVTIQRHQVVADSKKAECENCGSAKEIVIEVELKDAAPKTTAKVMGTIEMLIVDEDGKHVTRHLKLDGEHADMASIRVRKMLEADLNKELLLLESKTQGLHKRMLKSHGEQSQEDCAQRKSCDSDSKCDSQKIISFGKHPAKAEHGKHGVHEKRQMFMFKPGMGEIHKAHDMPKVEMHEMRIKMHMDEKGHAKHGGQEQVEMRIIEHLSEKDLNSGGHWRKQAPTDMNQRLDELEDRLGNIEAMLDELLKRR